MSKFFNTYFSTICLILKGLFDFITNYCEYNGTYLLNSSFWEINWASTLNGHSVNEGGSSGSPLINSNRRVIGQLFGPGYCFPPDPRCNNPSNVAGNYGKFSVSWTGSSDPNTPIQRRLNHWLDPTNNPNIIVLDGCAPIVYFTNHQPMTFNENIENSCGDIYVENVTVPSGKKLTLDAAGTTTIDSNFEVALGAELEIK